MVMDASVKPKKKWKLKMPGAFTILFFLTVISVFLTWFVPAGSYSKLSYSHDWNLIAGVGYDMILCKMLLCNA